MGIAVWVDEEERIVWAQGTHEYRPLGTAALALGDRFRNSDFRQGRRVPGELRSSFAGFFGSLETLNESLNAGLKRRLRHTPAHLL